MKKRRLLRARGFTLVELLVTVTILAFCLTGIALTYVNLFLLSDLSRDFTSANNALQFRLENLTRYDFSTLNTQAGLFNLTDYGFSSANSKGRIDIQENYEGYAGMLTRVRLVACFQIRGNLVGNNLTTCDASPVEVVTLRAQ